MEHPPRRPANPDSFCLSSRPRDLMSSPHFGKALLGCARLCPALLCSGDLMSSPHFARLCSAVLGFARLCCALGT